MGGDRVRGHHDGEELAKCGQRLGDQRLAAQRNGDHGDGDQRRASAPGQRQGDGRREEQEARGISVQVTRAHLRHDHEQQGEPQHPVEDNPAIRDNATVEARAAPAAVPPRLRRHGHHAPLAPHPAPHPAERSRAR